MHASADLPPALLSYIVANFPFAPVPTVAEICIRKFTPTSSIARLAEMVGPDFQTPYWASWWGGGLALARYVLDRPESVAGKRALDLGCGSGLVGIAAAKAGAAHVLAADVDPFAIALTRLNAMENGVTLDTLLGDPTASAPPQADLIPDIILGGDVFYDAALALRMTSFLERCRAQDIAVLVGDPGRASLPRERLTLIAEYEGPDFGDGAETSGRNRVFAFDRGDRAALYPTHADA